VVSADAVNVRENGEGRFFVKLDGPPAGNATVSVSRVAGDADITVKQGASLTFTPANWNVWQRVTLAAASDADALNGTATIRVNLNGAAPADVTATELDDDIGPNRALAAGGASITGGSNPGRLIDGIHNTASNYGYTNWTTNPPRSMVLDLKAPMALSRIRLLNYDWTYRFHRYRIESSPDGGSWSALVDASAGEHDGWQDWAVSRTARYLRFTGLYNSANAGVCISEWEVYGTPGGISSSLHD
jgi:hypothetical protein